MWVVNCNPQRLDGPVRGNGGIIDELERLLAGAGWNVIKLIWGSDWDSLFARDSTGALIRTLGATVDGPMQTFAAKDGRYNRDHFFGQNPEVAALAQGLADEQIDHLKRGDHDLVKISARQRCHLGRRRPAGARLLARATSGRTTLGGEGLQQGRNESPDGCHHS